MNNIIKILIFLIYTIVIFFVRSYYVLSIMFILNIFLIMVFKLSVKKAIYELVILSCINVTIFVANLIMGNIEEAILVSVRLILIVNITYIIKNSISKSEFIETFEIILTPLKIFKINVRDIGLVIYIAITFISVLTEEITQKKYALKAKGIKLNIKNIRYIIIPFFNSIFKRTNEISIALKAKGYIE